MLYNADCSTLLSPDMCPNSWMYLDDNDEWALDIELQMQCGMFWKYNTYWVSFQSIIKLPFCYSVTHHITFFLLDCWDILLGQLTLENVLISNGATVDVTDDNTTINFDSCGNNIFFGHNIAEPNDQISKIFKGTGKAILLLGNCWSTGYVSVFINETEIGRLFGQRNAALQFSYSKGDELSIKEFNASFVIDGCGKLTYCNIILLAYNIRITRYHYKMQHYSWQEHIYMFHIFPLQFLTPT